MKTTFPFAPADRRNSDRFLLVALFLFQTIFGFSQLSGTYTIGAAQDYENFTEAVEALNLYGINNPVIFNVVSGTYTEQPVLNSISGTSATNTVTFQSQSGDSTSVILQFDGTEYANNYVLLIDGADFVTFKNLTFKAIGDDAYGKVIEMDGHCHDITFTNNEFYGIDANDAHAGKIIFRGKMEDSGSGSYNITINNNRFYKGGYAIYLQGDNSVYLSGSHISGNTFVETGYASVYCNFNYAPVITYNTIDTKSYGIRVNGDYGGGIYSFNHVNSERTGIEIHRHGSGGNRALISNNLVSIGEHGNYGLSIVNSVMIDVYYNSVYVNSNSVVSAAFYSAYGVDNETTVNVRNNNFANKNGGYAVHVQTPGVLTSMDHNNLYTAGNYIAAWNNVKIFDLYDLQTASGLNSASLFVYPHYVADEDPHTVAPWLDNTGIAIPGIDVDFDGELRHAVTPDIGADEFTADPSTTTPLSGTYTIGSGGNYSTIASAFEDALMKGVSASLSFSLLDGTYNEQLVIRAIPGASMDRRITLASQSGNPEDAIISYSSDDYYQNWVMQLHGTDFITIQNLTVKAEGSTYARVIDLWQGADSVEIRGNILEGRSGNQANHEIIYSGDSDYRNRRIEENILKRGTFGVFMRRDQNNYQYPTGAKILNNIITENGYTGIHLQFYEAPVITGNKIEAQASGIKALSCSNDLIINKNTIKVYDIGIQMSTCYGTEEKKGLISNNFIHIGGNSGVEGININSSSNQLVLNNSVHLTNTAATSKAFYISSGSSSSVTILNNIFANTGGGYSYYVTTPATVVDSDYNDLYSSGGILAYWGASAENLEALRVASSMEEHSISIHPQFNTDTDLHTMAEALDSAGVSLAAVPDDIDGDPRHLLYPDIGADEFSFIPNHPPVAVNDTITTAIEITIHPLLNDYDTDNDTLTIVDITTPNQGTASILPGDTTILYTPVNFSPQYDTIQYIIQDDHGGYDTAQIFITLFREMKGFVKMDFALDSISHGSAKFGDIDNDGDLDILQTGWQGDNQEYVSQIYTYNNETYTKRNPGLTGLSSGTPEGSAMIDFDNDEVLELLITGIVENTASTRSTMFYDNQYPLFPEITDFPLKDVTSGSVDWGDFNRDGKYDLLLSGKDGSGNAVTAIYENKGETDGVWKMELYSDELPGIINGESNWVDFDNDGDLDIFLCGAGAGLTPLYRNDNGSFNPVVTALSAFTNAASDWADYDLDGDLDLAICGILSDVASTYIFRNDGYDSDTSWFFNQIVPGLQGVSSGDIAWGDYDNDGDPDLIVSGNTGAFTSTTRLYENSAGSLMDTNIPFPDLGRGSVAWGDYDHDGDLDLLFTGYCPALESKLTQIYRNDIPVQNDPPSLPANLSALFQEDHILFSWDPSNDTESPSDALSYNLRIGTTSGGNDVYSSMAHGSGIRKLPEIGNAGQTATYSIYGLPEGTYYWSIQAIDQGFAASVFSEESTVILTGTDEFGRDEEFMVYPNPADDHIILQLYKNIPAEDYILKIHSMTGKTVRERIVQVHVAGQKFVIQVDDLHGGLYLISLSGNGIICKAKFIKL